MSTLVLMIGAAVAGAWLGAGFVSRWPRRRIQIGMGVLLFVAAGIMVARVTGFMPGGGDSLGLEGPRLAIGIAGNFVLGALMTLGIGLYAPCMILVAFLGMHDAARSPTSSTRSASDRSRRRRRCTSWAMSSTTRASRAR